MRVMCLLIAKITGSNLRGHGFSRPNKGKTSEVSGYVDQKICPLGFELSTSCNFYKRIPLHLSIVGCLAGTKDLLAIVSSHTQALKAIAAAKSAISCKNRILSVRTTDFQLLPCGSKATELLQILVATIIDHCPSVYANKLKIARGIFPNGLAIIVDSRKLVVYSSCFSRTRSHQRVSRLSM